MKALKRVSEEREKEYGLLRKLSEPHANGTQCPRCDVELWDSHPLQILGSIPQKMDVYCPECGYRGYQSLFQLEGGYFIVPGSKGTKKI